MLIIIMFGCAILLITWYRNKQKSTRKNKTVGSELLLNENTAHLIEQQKESYESIISGQKQQIKSLQMAVNRYKGIYPDEDEEEVEKQSSKSSLKNLEENYEIDMEKAIPLIQSLKGSIPFLNNMDESKIPSLLNNPMVKTFIWDYIKKNKDQVMSLGVLVPKGSSRPILLDSAPKNEQVEKSALQDENYPTKNLDFDQKNNQYMA